MSGTDNIDVVAALAAEIKPMDENIIENDALGIDSIDEQTEAHLAMLSKSVSQSNGFKNNSLSSLNFLSPSPSPSASSLQLSFLSPSPSPSSSSLNTNSNLNSNSNTNSNLNTNADINPNSNSNNNYSNINSNSNSNNNNNNNNNNTSIVSSLSSSSNSNSISISNGNSNTQIMSMSKQETEKENFVDITEYLNLPQIEAAKKLGIPTSTLSKRWKEAAVNRKWPYRTVAKLDKEIMTLLHNIPQGPEAPPLPAEIEGNLGHLLRKRQDELRTVVIRM